MSGRALRWSAFVWAVLAAVFPGRPPPHAHADGYARVTTYVEAGVTYGGTWTTAGRTAACSKTHLWQTVQLVEAGLWLVCEDTGAAWWFEDWAGGDSNRVDVFGIWLPRDYYTVVFW